MYPVKDCKRNIVVTEGYGINITSVHIDILKSSNQHETNCTGTGDYLRFLTSEGRVLFTVCGQESFSLRVDNNKVTVEFVGTHNSVNSRYEGFNFHFEGKCLGL